MITVAIGLPDRIIIATDRTIHPEAAGLPAEFLRFVEVERDFVVAGSGIWATADEKINTSRDVLAAFRNDDNATSFLHRYDRMYRATLERFLTQRFADAPEATLRECFCPLMPPQSLVVGEFTGKGTRLTIFEYIPTLTNENTVVLMPLMQTYDVGTAPAYVAIGAAAPYVANLDSDYVTRAVSGPRGPEHTASALVEEAIAHTPKALGPAQVRTVHAQGPGRVRVVRQPRGARAVMRGSPNTPTFPPVDTRDIVAVQGFVQQRFNAIFPNAQFSWLPVVFSDIERFFRGDDPTYAALDLQYHDLEHTLQATVCLTALLSGRHASRVAPRIDAHHFELAVAAALLHDSGYLKLRADTRGTGAKYTFCHVLRSCAFAASYLPQIGATGADVETVMSAINCTGPSNEMSRLRFQAPVDEIIGCAVATADYLGQMAAADYPDELGILFDEFRESDDFLHIPAEDRMFKSAHDLAARTPHFWHRYVLPKLDADFHGVYRFLANPYPNGRNPYIDAVEANIVEIQRRLAERAQPALGKPVEEANAGQVIGRDDIAAPHEAPKRF
jgi:hypothetical protein